VIDPLHPFVADHGAFYAVVSGWFGDLAIVGAVVAFLRHRNCHVRPCWRLGRHPVAGTDHVVCRKHHPDESPSAQDVIDDHEAAK
jgi:hypothetical protein